MPSSVTCPEVILGIHVSLGHASLVPLDRPLVVLRDAPSMKVATSKFTLSVCMPLKRSGLKPLERPLVALLASEAVAVVGPCIQQPAGWLLEQLRNDNSDEFIHYSEGRDYL